MTARRVSGCVPCEKAIRGSRALCGAPVLGMEHSSQHVSPLDWTSPRPASHQRYWTLLIDALMWPRMVVVGDVRCQHPLELPLAKDQELVQALLAHGANPTFSVGMRMRRLHRRADDRGSRCYPL